jgi:hypothetical protein
MRWAVLPLLLAGCQYTPPSTPSDGTVAIDITIEQDVLPDPELCTDDTSTVCLGNVLRECEVIGQLPESTPCAICTGTPAHCEELVPSADVATTADLAPNGLIVDTTINANATADTETGEISGVRPQGEGILNGIGYRRTGTAGIWTFHELVINASIRIVGNRAAVFAANRTITVNALLDVRAQCGNVLEPSPGGGAGGFAEQDGSGPGKGLRGSGSSNDASGGSGGGHGVAGSGGASSTTRPATTGGVLYGDPQIMQLRGGSGGGGGGGELFTAGIGGFGGGALQVVANDAVTFNSAGGANAGGCGALPNADQNAGGGGGGAGGTILVEASVVTINAGAILAVNGGGGGGGDDGQGGQDGQLSRTAATGGNGVGGDDGTTGGRGGAGGAPGALSGTAGVSGTSNLNGGGGGGAVGRIRITTRDDTNLIGDCAACSPNFTDDPTTITRGAAKIQTAP